MPYVLELSPWQGGSIIAEDLAALRQAVIKERDSWLEYISKPPSHNADRRGRELLIREIAGEWTRFDHEIAQQGQDFTNIVFPDRRLLRWSSLEGANIRTHIEVDDLAIAASQFNNLSNEATIRSVSSDSSELVDHQLRNTIEEALRARWPDITSLRENVQQAQANVEMLQGKLVEASISAQQAVENLDSTERRMVEEWGALLDAYRERLDLDKVSHLWRERSIAHRAEAKKLGEIAFVAGVVSIIGPVIAALALFHSAATILGPSSVDIQRAIFSTAGTLLVLTLCLWLTRILVRLYMTERHLATDAEARAALGDTYISLTAEGAAAAEDRKIVLAALFRPVADGIVQEDGMPLVTPAAIASAALLGPAKTN